MPLHPQPAPAVHWQFAPHLHAVEGAVEGAAQEPEPQQEASLVAQAASFEAPAPQHEPAEAAAGAEAAPLQPHPVPGVHLQPSPQPQAAVDLGCLRGQPTQPQLAPQLQVPVDTQLQD